MTAVEIHRFSALRLYMALGRYALNVDYVYIVLLLQICVFKDADLTHKLTKLVRFA